MYSISIEEDVGTEEIEILRDRIDQHTQSIFRDRISKQLLSFYAMKFGLLSAASTGNAARSAGCMSPLFGCSSLTTLIIESQ
jgi:hypothetical protein